jgi:hypothetical protein
VGGPGGGHGFAIAERLKELGAGSKVVNEFARRTDLTLHQVNETWDAVQRDTSVDDPMGALVYRLRNNSPTKPGKRSQRDRERSRGEFAENLSL